MNKIYSDDFERLSIRNLNKFTKKKLSMADFPINEDVESENQGDHDDGNSSDGSSSTMSFRSRRSNKMLGMLDPKEPKFDGDSKKGNMSHIEPILEEAMNEEL